ncbi:nck-associated protein 5-like isoform X2 [Rhinatrema bivittatum]|uniref:nck-associated protein 5-like isoform X2 n=1 Tax=Rhinatrema bivittatum TaxID=194408 RepID=UPI0011282020|nr:nck-associated protein 5-like isoform X2 [Rhinatrema bivittatum]
MPGRDVTRCLGLRVRGWSAAAAAAAERLPPTRPGSGLCAPPVQDRAVQPSPSLRALAGNMSEATEELSMHPVLEESTADPGVSHELLERLRALEAENSALAQANENQRETYERCLDEVANHVVQALLNQKDLREECLKLKKRVYELERQNRTLSDLFHQKLQIASGSLPQLPVHPFQVLSNLSLVPHLGTVEKHSTSFPLGQCVMQKQVSPERQQMGTVSVNTPSPSMEALSPFLKKKAQILAVLRKLEEMDPLVVCPRSNPGQCFSAHNCQSIRNSCSLKYKQDGGTRHEPGSPECLNGEGFLPAGIQVPEYEPWTACLLLAQSGLEDLLKWKPACSDSSGAFREEEDLEETMALVQEGCRDLDGAEAELLSSRCCQGKSTGSSSSSSDDNCEVGEANLLEKCPPDSLLSMIAEEKMAFGQLLQDTESYLYSVMKERNGDQAISILCEESQGFGGKRGPDKGVPKVGLTEPGSAPVSESLGGEMLRETSQAEKYKHSRTADCYSQSAEELLHHNTEDKVQEMATSEDFDVWKDAEKTVLDSTSDCSPTAKCRVNALAQSSMDRQTLFSLYVSSDSLNAQQEVGESTSTNITEKTVHSFPVCSSQVKNELQMSPSSIVDSEDRRAPQIPSPSKFLKLLKIPTGGERTQSPNHLRLSPQLTRSSKIPCRNNYEVYHSPLLRRKAAVTEQVPEGTSKNESLYGIPSLLVPVHSEVGFGNSNSSSGKVNRHSVSEIANAGAHDLRSFGQEAQSFQKAPNYENVCYAIDSIHSSAELDPSKHFLLPAHAGNQTSQDKVDASELMESVCHSRAAGIGAPPQTTLLSDGASSSCSQALCLYSNTKDKQKEKFTSEPKEKSFESPQVLQRSSGSASTPKKLGGITGKKQGEPPGHLPFRERLTALGKLKSSESPLQGAERKETPCGEKEVSPVKTNLERNRVSVKQCEINEGYVASMLLNSEASETREPPKWSPGVNSLKHQERCFSGDIGVKCYHSNSVGSKLETENYSSKIYIVKGESSRNKITGAFCSPGSQVSRTSAKFPATPSFCKNPKSPHGSPTKLPSKSPTKASVKGGVSRPLSDEMRSCTRTGGPMPPSTQEEKLKVQQPNTSRKSAICSEYSCQGFSRTSPKAKNTENVPLSSMLHSAIEEKVMKGIKENMLRLQEQDKVPVTEGKQKASSSIASWFGLKKSKLPALSRRPDVFKTKDEKREWSVGASPLRKEVKMATKKMEAESLNISMLMEKAEDLRKALEEEKAYMNGISREKSRGITCDVEQTQNELRVTYSKEARPDSFMQQLLNRVDGKEISSEGRPEPRNEQRDLQKTAQDSKSTKTCLTPRNGIMSHLQSCEENPEQNKDVVMRGEVPSDENLVESVTSQHFPACGSLTRTLDSGMGTFPPPDYCGGTPSKNAPKLKPRVEPPSAEKLPVLPKAPWKARTLEREVPSMEETLTAGQHQSVPAFHALLASPETTLGSRVRKEDCSRNPAQPKRIQHSNNWTFPNLKASAGSPDAFLSSTRDVEVLHSSLGSTKGSPSEVKRSSDLLHLPHHFPGSRTPSTSDVGEEGGTDVRSADTGQGQAGLENSESLSDSLYDSLSSCGSQG